MSPTSPTALHPKVKVPHVVLQVIAVLSLVLALAGQVPAAAPIVAEITALLQLASGYITAS